MSRVKATTARRQRIAISLRLKAMASMILIVATMFPLLGFLVQHRLFEKEVEAHRGRVEFTASQLANQYPSAFKATSSVEELNKAMLQAVNQPSLGLVFVAALAADGGTLAYSRGPDYVGSLDRDLERFGHTKNTESFAPTSYGHELKFQLQPVTVKESVDDPAVGKRLVTRDLGHLLLAYSTRQVELEFMAVQKHIWSVIATVGVVACLLVWFSAHTFIRPIKELILGTRRVAAGDYDRPVMVKTSDELRTLADSFNLMSGQLRETLDLYDRQNKDLEKIVQDRTRELREAYQELRALDRLKDGFLSSISHEFRTPITSIRAFTEILTEDADAPPEVQAEFLGIIQKETQRLEGLVNGILDLVKIEAGEMPYSFVEVEATQPVRRALAAVAEIAEQAGVRVDAQLPDPGPMVVWDADKITRTVQELLCNAIRFSPAGESVQLTMAQDSSCYTLQVRDHGPGIPADMLEQVFEKFHQVGETLTDKPNGTGVGLHIAREMVYRHHGTLCAKRPEGGGALLVITLPMEVPVEPLPETSVPAASTHDPAAEMPVATSGVTAEVF